MGISRENGNRTGLSRGRGRSQLAAKLEIRGSIGSTGTSSGPHVEAMREPWEPSTSRGAEPFEPRDVRLGIRRVEAEVLDLISQQAPISDVSRDASSLLATPRLRTARR